MHYDPILCMNVPDKTKDAPSKGHEIVMLAENYLRSIGKNNSTGKYDRVVQGVRSLLSQGYLEGEELKKAVQQEADRLLKKYNPKDAKAEDAARAYSVGYKSNGVFQSIGVMANSEQEAVEKAKRYFASKGRAVEVYGASIGESLETMKMKGKPILDKAIQTCDADKGFERYYVSFASSIKATKNMAPKTANTYVGKLLKGYLDDLDKEYNEMSREYTAVRNKISKMGEEEMSAIFERYLKEGKK